MPTGDRQACPRIRPISSLDPGLKRGDVFFYLGWRGVRVIGAVKRLPGVARLLPVTVGAEVVQAQVAQADLAAFESENNGTPFTCLGGGLMCEDSF